MIREAEILENLFSNWIGLAHEYANGAPDLRAVYLYASSERGARFANVYYDQGGTIKHPGDVHGIDAALGRVRQVQNLLVDDLLEAEKELASIGIPKPTEYRVYFESATRKLDVQLPRDEIYGADGRSRNESTAKWLLSATGSALSAPSSRHSNRT